MLSLPEFQRGFASALMDRDAPWCAEHLLAQRMPAEARLDVYRNNVFASLGAALLAVYPVCARLVGEACFRGLAREYIRHHPSNSGNLHEFGSAFAVFLAADARLSELVYLPDVARLEWAWHRVYRADDSALRFDRYALARIDTEQWNALRLRRHPATLLLASDYPVLRIWQTNQDGCVGEATVSLDEGGDRVLVARRGLEMEFQRLGHGEYALLAALERYPLQRAHAAALAAQADFDLGDALQRFIQQDVLIDWRVAPSISRSVPDVHVH